MTREAIHQRVLDALLSVAPEADPLALAGSVRLRDQLDMDSMDFLNFVIAIHESLHVEIPERDYPRLMTIDGCVEYLNGKLLN
jgi:acyl carrier protein